MFYEALGTLLGQAAGAFANAPAGGGDARSQREIRNVSTLLRRTGAIWPRLFRTLGEETSILEATFEEVSAVAREHGIDVAPPSEDRADPLARYAALQRSLDELTARLHATPDEAWASDALRRLRRGLTDAAEAQGRLVDEMLAS